MLCTFALTNLVDSVCAQQCMPWTQLQHAHEQAEVVEVGLPLPGRYCCCAQVAWCAGVAGTLCVGVLVFGVSLQLQVTLCCMLSGSSMALRVQQLPLRWVEMRWWVIPKKGLPLCLVFAESSASMAVVLCSLANHSRLPELYVNFGNLNLTPC